MQISKDDYIYWRNLPTHDKFVEEMIQILDEAKAYLMVNAGKNPIEDRKLVGVIEGVQWLIDWQPTFIEEGEHDDAEGTGV